MSGIENYGHGNELFHTIEDNFNCKDTNADIGLKKLEVGSKYPGVIPQTEGGYFDMTDCGGSLTIFFKNPKVKEIEEIKKGDIKIALTVKDGCTFFLIKFGEMAWMDMPYDARLSKNLTELQKLSPTQGYALHITLVDMNNREVKVLRLIGLPNRFSNALKTLIHERLYKIGPTTKLYNEKNKCNIQSV